MGCMTQDRNATINMTRAASRMHFAGKTDFDCTTDGKMRLSEDGKLMNVDFIPMVGSEQPGKLVFEKQ